jgi:hypothetical protein
MWGFQKGELLSPEQILEQSMPSYAKVPASWNPTPQNPFDKRWSEASDVGTYWIFLEDLPALQDLALHVTNVFSSFRVLTLPLGTEGSSFELTRVGWNDNDPLGGAEASVSDWHFLLPLKQHDQKGLLVVFQVANPHYPKGGIRAAPRIGLINDMYGALLKKRLVYGLLIGAMLIIAIYHFLIFYQRQDDKAAFWLAIECLFIAGHTLANNGLLEAFWPTPSNSLFSWRTRIVYSTHYIGPLAFYGFLTSTFPECRHRFDRWLVYYPAVLLSLLIFVTGFFYGKVYLLGFVLPMTISIAFIFWRTASNIKKDFKLKILLGGVLLLGLAAINDALASSGILQTPDLLPEAQTIFILLQGALISKRFAMAYTTASRLSTELQKEVESQTRDIRSVMQTIKQGIFIVSGSNLQIGKERSVYLDQLCVASDQPDLQRFFLDQIDIDNDVKQQIIETIRLSMNEEIYSFELNSHLLPREVKQTTDQQVRYFEADWGPVVNSKNEIEKILVCLRDVTELKILRSESEKHEDELRAIDELLSISEDYFKAFIRRATHYLDQSLVLAGGLGNGMKSDKSEALRQLFMNIHTVKGNARTLHLRRIALTSHDAEQILIEIRDNGMKCNPSEIIGSLESIRDMMHRYLEISHHKLGWDLKDENIRLPRRLLARGLHELASIRTTLQEEGIRERLAQIESKLQPFCRVDIASILKLAFRGTDSMARDLGKTPPVLVINVKAIMISEEGIDLLSDVFNHIFRNAIDHGIEEKAVRLAKGKSEAGTIRVAVEPHHDDLRIVYADDGGGLNLIEIMKRAQKAGWGSELTLGDRLQVAELIFYSGLSTKQQVTEISGRGVGMSAVREYLRKVGGDAKLHLPVEEAPLDATPFQLIINLPQPFWWESSSPASDDKKTSAINQKSSTTKS